MVFSRERLLEVLSHWNCSTQFETSEDQGLINQTWLIGNPYSSVLQWVNPIFSPLINNDIQTIAQEATKRGLLFPKIMSTNNGHSHLHDDGGFLVLLKVKRFTQFKNPILPLRLDAWSENFIQHSGIISMTGFLQDVISTTLLNEWLT